MGSFTFFSFLLLHYLCVHVTAQDSDMQNIQAKYPGTFSNFEDGLLNVEPPNTDDPVPDVYGVRDIDLPFFRLYHGNMNYFSAGQLNTPTGDADVWGGQYDNANQSACGIPDNAFWISKVAIHPYFLKFADLSRYCMQDVCISFWKEDGSQDMMLKVTDICSTDPNDPTHCASPTDIKIDRTKASIMEGAAMDDPKITGNSYPDKIWWFFTKCWDDGLAQPAYKGNNWFSKPVIPNNLNWSQSTADRQYQLNQKSYPQHGFETYPCGGYNTERNSITSPPITDWVPGQEPSWEPIAGGVGWGKRTAPAAPKAPDKDVSTKAPVASKAPDKEASTKEPAVSKAPSKDVSSKASDPAHTTPTLSSSSVENSSAAKAADHTPSKSDHDDSKSDSKAASTSESDSASKSSPAPATTLYKSHTHSHHHNETTYHNGTAHYNYTRTGSRSHSRTRKPCSITSTPGADSSPSAKEAPVPYASSTTSAGSPPSAPSGAGSAPSGVAQQNGGSSSSAANGADFGSGSASSSISSGAGSMPSIAAPSYAPSGASDSGSAPSSTSSGAGSAPSAYPSLASSPYSSVAPDSIAPTSTPPACAVPVTVTLTDLITVTVTPSFPSSTAESIAGSYPSAYPSAATKEPESSAGSAATSTVYGGGMPVSTATVLPVPSNGSYTFTSLSPGFGSAPSTSLDTSGLAPSATSDAGAAASSTTVLYPSSSAATAPTAPSALPDSASALPAATTTPCSKSSKVKRRHEHVERHQRKARRGGHRK